MNSSDGARVRIADDPSALPCAVSAMLPSDGPWAIPDPDSQNIDGANRPVADLAASRGRVLVIEDDWFISSLVSGELTECGYEVIGPARNVAEAASFAGTAAIDAALVDLNLGGELPHAAIALLVERRVPFIFMTACSTVPESVGCAAPLLEKPFKRAELFAALEKILPARLGA
jgi:CheY-like chemotaxis protein